MYIYLPHVGNGGFFEGHAFGFGVLVAPAFGTKLSIVQKFQGLGERRSHAVLLACSGESSQRLMSLP